LRKKKKILVKLKSFIPLKILNKKNLNFFEGVFMLTSEVGCWCCVTEIGERLVVKLWKMKKPHPYREVGVAEVLFGTSVFLLKYFRIVFKAKIK
jgi:hypothetical protein